jgi:serine/threonine-protein kinase
MGIFSGLFGGGPRRVDLWKRFERLRESNSGTMSAFYKVRDLQDGEIRGLKLIDREKTAPIEGRYKGLGKPPEGEIGTQIVGPNIVKTLEWGATTDGRQFIVQEFVEGTMLHSLISAKKPFPPAKRIDLVRQAATAISTVPAVTAVRAARPRSCRCSASVVPVAQVAATVFSATAVTAVSVAVAGCCRCSMPVATAVPVATAITVPATVVRPATARCSR